MFTRVHIYQAELVGEATLKSEQILDFIEYVEGQKNQSLKELLGKILRKSRLLTGADAGTIFVKRTKGRKSWLEPANVQNDSVKVQRSDFVVPIGPGTIAGYVAHSGKTVKIDDVYEISARKPYRFDPSREHKDYKTHSMFCFPLTNFQHEVIGVVQLINCRPRKNAKPAPFSPDVSSLVGPISRVVGHSIERATMMDQIKTSNKELRQRNRLLDEQRAQIVLMQEETEEAFQLSTNLLARAAEIHDEETGNHIVRVNEYSYLIAKKLGMQDNWCDEIRYSAQLHDVGKMSVDSAVLKKKGPLDTREREEMNRHTVYGYQILSASPRLKLGAEIALYHHEKWDGTGYPNGTSGEAIPLSARIVQIADIYDALRSTRPYKKGFSHAKTLKILSEGDDRIDPFGHFDPKMIRLFHDNHGEFEAIWNQLKD
ncbi:MAG: HD domain-containing phosphohydrolase [Gammaproteobacteria bacterium]